MFVKVEALQPSEGSDDEAILASWRDTPNVGDPIAGRDRKIQMLISSNKGEACRFPAPYEDAYRSPVICNLCGSLILESSNREVHYY